MIIKKAFYLLLSGSIAGLGMLLFASGKVFGISSELVNASIVLIAWQALGVTISKLGADQIIFARSVGKSGLINIRPVIERRIVPLSGVFFAASVAKYPVGVACIIFVTVVLDAISILLHAKLSAELQTEKLFISSFLNYPVFLILLFFAPKFFAIDLMLVSIAFCTSSLLRFIYLVFFTKAVSIKKANSQKTGMQIDGSIVLGSYQAINYWIFKGGQVFAGFNLYSTTNGIVSKFIFCWVAIDFIDKFNSAISPLVYRKMALKALSKNTTLAAGISLVYFVMFLAFFFYSSLILSVSLDPIYVAALSLNAFLIFIPNYLIFRVIRSENYLVLIKAGLSSCILSAVIYALFCLGISPVLALVIFTPCQLLLFSIFLYFFADASILYEKSLISNSI